MATRAQQCRMPVSRFQSQVPICAACRASPRRSWLSRNSAPTLPGLAGSSLVSWAVERRQCTPSTTTPRMETRQIFRWPSLHSRIASNCSIWPCCSKALSSCCRCSVLIQIGECAVGWPMISSRVQPNMSRKASFTSSTTPVSASVSMPARGMAWNRTPKASPASPMPSGSSKLCLGAAGRWFINPLLAGCANPMGSAL